MEIYAQGPFGEYGLARLERLRDQLPMTGHLDCYHYQVDIRLLNQLLARVERARYAELRGRSVRNLRVVMADDLALRQARLRLMKRLEQLILQLGDISEIVAVE